MKMYINIIILALTALVCVSCTDFVNNYVPEKIISEDAYFKMDADLIKVINPLYSELFSSFSRPRFWEITACDDMIFGRDRNTTFTDIVNFKPQGREDGIHSNNEIVTTVIARSNWLIYNILKKGQDNFSPVGKRVLGEAYFIRGYAHFLYAYRMGRADNGVPFDRYEDYDPYLYGIPEQRETVMKNYELIIEDLTKAADLLPFFDTYGDDDYGRTHKTAAWAAMVKAYAHWAAHDPSKWALIPALVDKIEIEGKRKLLDNFYDVFTVVKGNWSAEEIWSMNGNPTYFASYWASMPIENKGWGRVNSWGYFKPTLGLYNEFEPGDQRRAVTMLEYNDEFQFYGETRRFFSNSDHESGFMFAKTLDPFRYGEVVDGVGISPYVYAARSDIHTGLNIPIFRFAEMLLFKAEALIEQGKPAEAAQVLNRITTRAGLGNKYTSATMANLMHERRCELASEHSDRFGDLRRWCIIDDANHRGLALPMLRAPKMGRHYANRSDPTSTWTPIDITEGDKTRNFDPEVHIAWPYNPDDVSKAGGKLKQNKGYD